MKLIATLPQKNRVGDNFTVKVFLYDNGFIEIVQPNAETNLPEDSVEIDKDNIPALIDALNPWKPMEQKPEKRGRYLAKFPVIEGVYHEVVGYDGEKWCVDALKKFEWREI